jgi:hypothetical protein
MQEQRLAGPAVPGWQHDWCAVYDYSEVADQAGIQHVVQPAAVGQATLPEPAELGSLGG